MKIIIKEPAGPFGCEIDSGAMDVILRDVFKGVAFETHGGEKLGVSMRDNGFEVHYRGFGAMGFDSGWVDFKDGVINLKERKR